KASIRPERERLPDIRKGEFEALRERIGRDPVADPDVGPKRIHPTAGATAIGARPFLVAFNIYLDTGDVTIAKDIAKRIRTSSGGLPAVQASGFEVEGKAQVSMNLLDIDVTSPATVFAAVAAAARQRGVAVLKSEVVGLVPERAVLGAGAASLTLAHAEGLCQRATARGGDPGRSGSPARPATPSHGRRCGRVREGQRGLPPPERRSAPDACRGRGARRRGADAARDGPRCGAASRARTGNRDDRQPERALRCLSG